MPRPYSADLRLRVLQACQAAEVPRAEIARRFLVSESTLYLWRKQQRAEGRSAPKAHAGGPAPRLDGSLLGRFVRAQNDRTLAECATLYERETGMPISLSSVSRLLGRLALPRKKRRSAPASRSAKTSPPRGRHSGRR
jgi:transposase